MSLYVMQLDRVWHMVAVPLVPLAFLLIDDVSG